MIKIGDTYVVLDAEYKMHFFEPHTLVKAHKAVKGYSPLFDANHFEFIDNEGMVQMLCIQEFQDEEGGDYCKEVQKV